MSFCFTKIIPFSDDIQEFNNTLTEMIISFNKYPETKNH